MWRSIDAVNPPQENRMPEPVMFRVRPPKKKRRIKRWVLLLVVILCLVWAGGSLLSKTNQIFSGKLNIFTRIGRLIVGDDKPLKGEEEGKINVLLMGIGGIGHEGANLTDTMIVASINANTKEVTLVSIPRDFLVQIPSIGFNKINAVYAYAERAKEGSGGEAVMKVAEKVTGLSMHYFAVVDFKGFVKAVNRLDGLDINVERTFTDAQYPDYNYGYLPPVTFTKGMEHMDGERALIFARSRKGSNGEGSDFARSERQKKIMVAMKDKLLGLDLTDLKTINGLLGDFTENFRTNMEPFEMKRLADLGREFSSDNIFTLSLEPDDVLICNGMIDAETGLPAPPLPKPEPATEPADTATGTAANTTTKPAPSTTTNRNANEQTPATTPATEPISDGIIRMYVVQPCENKTLDDIKFHLSSALEIIGLQKENVTIEIQNSTGKSYAADTWRVLNLPGITIKFTAFRGKSTFERTILYDNSRGSKPKSLNYLKDKYDLPFSDVPFYDVQPGTDFVIVVGKDAL
jgi:LCP family protein required for cell wall assembly